MTGASTAAPAPVVASVNAGVARVWLNRPDAGNAIDLPTATAFRDAIAGLARDQAVRVIVLGASGRLFCAGGDVRGLVSQTSPPGDFGSAVDRLVQTVAQRPGNSAGETARLLRLAASTDYAAQLAREAAAITRLVTTPDAAAAIGAFAAQKPGTAL